jgi:hypothetical protein
VASVDPAIEALHEFAGHAVRVPEAELCVKHFALVRFAGPLGVEHVRDRRDAVDKRPLAVGIRYDADRDVELVGKRGYLARSPVGPEVFENLDGVAAFPRLGSERILNRLGHPEPARGIEIDIDRLANLGIGRDQLQLEAGRQLDLLDLLLGPQRIGGSDVRAGRPFGFFLLLGGRSGNQENGRQEQKCNAVHDDTHW